MASTSKSTKSPDPRYRGLVISVDEVLFHRAAGVLPPEGTLYGSAAFENFFQAEYNPDWKNYVYVGQGEDTDTGGTLHFAPGIPPEESNIPFRVTTDFRDFYWDTILFALIFIKDQLGRSGAYVNKDGAGIAVGSRYRVREVYIPGGKMGTLFTTKEYLSPTPIMPPLFETPVPRSVTYDVPGARGGFPSCIGPKIVVPSLEAGVITAVAGEIAGIGGALTGQIFPETNVVDWEKRVISFEQKLTPSGYHAVEVWVDPPEQPEITIS